MHFSTLITALAATARAYEITLYNDVGWSGTQASFSFDGHHPLEYALITYQRTQPLCPLCSF